MNSFLFLGVSTVLMRKYFPEPYSSRLGSHNAHSEGEGRLHFPQVCTKERVWLSLSSSEVVLLMPTATLFDLVSVVVGTGAGHCTLSCLWPLTAS